MDTCRCPKCGSEMTFVGKDPCSGNEWREYKCPSCGNLESEGGGQALWSVLHDDAEQQRAFKRIAPRLPADIGMAGCFRLMERLSAGDREAIRAVVAVFENCEERLDAEDAGVFLGKARGEFAVNETSRLLQRAIEHRKI